MTTARPRRNRAGASAQKMADAIRAAERRRQHLRAAWVMPLVIAAAVAAGYLLGSATSTQAGIALALTLCAIAVRRLYRNSGSTWARGAAGERATARLLIPMTWPLMGRWAILHDRQIPRSRANLDTLALGPCGPVYIDTKAYKATSRISADRHGRLWYGGRPMTKTLDTVEWEADQAARALDHPVRAVIAVHGAKVPGGVLQHGQVAIVQAPLLRRYLRNLPEAPGWNHARIDSARQLADLRLPPAAT